MSGESELVQGSLSALPEHTRVSKCSQQLCPLRPQTCFPTWTPCALLRGRAPGGSAGRAPSQTLQVQGWNQRLPAPRSVHLPAGSGFPNPRVCSRPRRSGLRASARSRSPALPAQGRPRLSRCSGPGAASAGQCPPALPKANLAAGPLLCAHPAGQGADGWAPEERAGRPCSSRRRKLSVRTTNRLCGFPGRGQSRARRNPARTASRAALAPDDAEGSGCPSLCPCRLPAVLPMPTLPTVTHRRPQQQQHGEYGCHRPPPLRSRLTPRRETRKSPQGCPRDTGASQPTPFCCGEEKRTPTTPPRPAGPPRGGMRGPGRPPPAAEGAGRARCTYPGARVRTWVARR